MSEGKGPGQPTKVSDSIARSIAAKVRSGIPLKEAAKLCGIGERSLFNYFKWADEGRGEWQSFARIVRAAIPEGKKPKQAG